MQYINKKTLIKLINETENTPYWMQKLVMKLYWSFQKHSETWMTLKDCWNYLRNVNINRFNPYEFPSEGCYDDKLNFV